MMNAKNTHLRIFGPGNFPPPGSMGVPSGEGNGAPICAFAPSRPPFTGVPKRPETRSLNVGAFILSRRVKSFASGFTLFRLARAASWGSRMGQPGAGGRRSKIGSILERNGPPVKHLSEMERARLDGAPQEVFLLSRIRVTGPSLTRWTSIISWNSPVPTRIPMPRSRLTKD